MHTVILSRRRAHRVLSLALFPDATICVEESEVKDYAHLTPNIWEHPPLPTLGALRRWVVMNSPDNVVVQVDDDLSCVISQVGQRPKKYTEPEVLKQVVENAAHVAEDLGVGCFGFNLIPDPRFFNPFDFIKFNRYVGGVFGIIGKGVLHDERLSLHDDVDFGLQQLLVNRVIYRDERFLFTGANDAVAQQGGNTAHRLRETGRRFTQAVLLTAHTAPRWLN